MNTVTVQVQSVLYNNEKWALKRALDSLSNAIKVNKTSSFKVGKVTVYYGDASPERIYSDAEISELQSEFKEYFQLKYTYFNENTGTAKGHNLMGEKCDSEYMVIMNPDVIVSPKFFEKMLYPFLIDDKNSVGITEARQTPVEHPKSYNRKTLETDWATTACVLFKTEDFRAINGFDAQTFFMYCDDLDFSWRMRLFGKKILYIPDCVVFHSKLLSFEGKWQPTKAEIYYSAEAALLVAYKWSADKRFQELYNIFKNSGDEVMKKAALHFDEMKQSGKLPTQLDKEHKVAKFVGDFYTKHRFTF